MPRKASYDRAYLEERIGPRISATKIDSTNRHLVQNWLVSMGFRSKWVKARGLNDLRWLYRLADDAALDSFRLLSIAAEPEVAPTDVGATPPSGAMAASLLTTATEIAVGKYPPTPAPTDEIPVTLYKPDWIVSGTTEPRTVTETFTAPVPTPAQPETETEATTAKLAAAAEALRAAAMLLDGKTAEMLGFPGGVVLAAPATHGDGPIPGTKMVRADSVLPVGGDMLVPFFTERTQYVPDPDMSYHFDQDTTLAILLGFAHNRRVLISGRHGTGKTSHIEQVAARLNWPCIRLNLDGHLSRSDLIGRDAIVLKDGKQITEFREGILPWAMSQPMALCLDEYDAGRPDVLFVVQRLLEDNGKLTVAEQNRVISPNPGFRLFGTANTIGLGDATGLYHGTNPLNAAQMDRWSISVRLDYLPHHIERKIVLGKCVGLDITVAKNMVTTANSTRKLFAGNKISTVMSPRTVIAWAENARLLGWDYLAAFRLSFLNKCDDAEQEVILACFTSAFGS